MLRLKQNDPRWGNLKIGKSKYTIGTNGCLITSVCMLWSKFHYTGDDYLTPAEAVKEWEFTAVEGDPDPRYLVWKSINYSGMKFIWRELGWNPEKLITDPVTGEKDLTFNIVKKYMKHPDYGIALKVINSKGEQHWLAGVGKSVFNWAANDPWNGKRLWAAPYPYTRLDGFALISKN